MEGKNEESPKPESRKQESVAEYENQSSNTQTRLVKERRPLWKRLLHGRSEAQDIYARVTGTSDGKYAEKVIEHLSKEIETINNNMTVFRTKISLAIFLGPFLLLGSVIIGAKGVAIAIKADFLFWLAVIGLVGCYLLIAYIASRIEQQAGEQCNEWRALIAQLYIDPSKSLTALDKEEAFNIRGPKLYNLNRSRAVYMWSYFYMILAFFMSTIIIGRIKPVDAPVNQQSLVIKCLTQETTNRGE
jgi:hypothetical protein